MQEVFGKLLVICDAEDEKFELGCDCVLNYSEKSLVDVDVADHGHV
jgi:hypothetical protein